MKNYRVKVEDLGLVRKFPVACTAREFGLNPSEEFWKSDANAPCFELAIFNEGRNKFLLVSETNDKPEVYESIYSEGDIIGVEDTVFVKSCGVSVEYALHFSEEQKLYGVPLSELKETDKALVKFQLDRFMTGWINGKNHDKRVQRLNEDRAEYMALLEN